RSLTNLISCGVPLRATKVGPGTRPSYPHRLLRGSAGWNECCTGFSWIRKNSVLLGTARGPCTWNAVVPSTFTQFAGSAWVGKGGTGGGVGGNPSFFPGEPADEGGGGRARWQVVRPCDALTARQQRGTTQHDPPAEQLSSCQLHRFPFTILACVRVVRPRS